MTIDPTQIGVHQALGNGMCVIRVKSGAQQYLRGKAPQFICINVRHQVCSSRPDDDMAYCDRSMRLYSDQHEGCCIHDVTEWRKDSGMRSIAIGMRRYCNRHLGCARL
jgi:hypothetical protein